MKNQLINYLKALTESDAVNLSKPPKTELGDFAFPTFSLAKQFRKNPNEIAQDLIEKINENKPDFIEKVEQAGPYINFYLSKNAYSDLFKSISLNLADKENAKRTIFIDYIGANVGKPLHIGHMCTPNLGQTIINTYRKLGYNVISDSHIGDWGIIFGKLIIAYLNWGDEEKLKENAVEHLFQLYVKATEEEKKDPNWNDKFQQAFKELAEGREDYVQLWALFTKESIKSMNKQLSKLNVKPDYNIGESFYEGLNLPKLEDYPDLIWSMKDIVRELIEKGIATKNEDSSVGIVFDEETKIPSCILQKRNGTHGYLASDLAAVKYRVHNWKPEKIIYFVDVRQSLHFKQVFKTAELAGWLESTKLIHAPNGFVKLKDGAMSTRKGKIIKLEALLDEAEKRAENIIKEKRPDISETELKTLGEIIGVGAIKYEYLRKNRELDVVFDWDQFMTFEGNSAPYIMYSYVRGLSILEKNNVDFKERNINYIFEKTEEQELIKILSQYKDILKETIDKNYPHILANYVYEVTKNFNNFYNNVQVLNENDEDKKISRLALIEKTTSVIEDGFNILGINLPRKM